MTTRLVAEEAKEGAYGCDLNQRVSPELAKLLVEHGYDFVVRYVRRAAQHAFDLSYEEASDILHAGLGLMIVQHVAPDGWLPTDALGHLQGLVAAREVEKLRLPEGVMVWCDLEGVAPTALPADIIAYCNAWFDEAKRVGTPGLYVGEGSGLRPKALYSSLRFTRYWAAYNLNADEYPSTRGVCLKQRVAKVGDRVEGVIQDGFDVDIVLRDELGSLPLIVYEV